MNTINIIKMKNYLLILLIGSMLVLITQKVGLGYPIIDALPGMGIIIIVSLLAILIREAFPRSIFPAFGWVTILGFLFSMPVNPLSPIFLHYLNKVDFIAITTPLLALAGISVGNKVEDLKKMSWRLVIIAVIVFITIFFACALIAELVLKLTGEI